MSVPERPDVSRIRHHLKWLVAVIVVAVVGLLSLTFYLYDRFTANVQVAE